MGKGKLVGKTKQPNKEEVGKSKAHFKQLALTV